MWAAGEESPRDNLVTPAPYGQDDSRRQRERQLRDEVKSGGNQPTDIRVIHRRNKPPASRTPDAAKGSREHKEIRKPGTNPNELTGQSISGCPCGRFENCCA